MSRRASWHYAVALLLLGLAPSACRWIAGYDPATVVKDAIGTHDGGGEGPAPSDGAADAAPLGDGPHAADSSTPPATGLCEVGWCWVNPLPHGYVIRAGWSSSATEWFAVGDQGVTLRYDDSTRRWTRLPGAAGRLAMLKGIWGSEATNIYAVGDNGTLLYFNGSAWSLDSPFLRDLSQESADLLAVWGANANEVVVAGSWAGMLHWDGTAWSAKPLPDGPPATKVWGSSPSRIFTINTASSPGGSAFLYDGTAWQLFAAAPAAFTTIWSGNAGELFATDNSQIFSYEGSAWRQDDTTFWSSNTLRALWGTSTSDLYAADGGGNVYGRTAAGAWQPMPSPASQHDRPLYALWGYDASSPVFAAGEAHSARRYERATGKWEALTEALTTAHLRAVSTVGEELVAVGDGGTVLRYRGGEWQHFFASSTPVPPGVDLYAICSDGAGFVAAGARDADGSTYVYHSALVQGLQTPAQGNINALWGSSPTTIFAATAVGEMLTFEGGAWSLMTPQPATTRPLNALWGTSASDLYACGDDGIFHFDGTDWEHQNTTQGMLSLWGNAATNVFAGGRAGKLFQYDGTSWKPVTTRTANHILGITLVGQTLYLVGISGSILSRALAAPADSPWSKVQVTGVNTFFDVVAAPGGGVFALGGDGAILHRTASAP